MAMFSKKTVDDVIGQLTKMQAQLKEVIEHHHGLVAAAEKAIEDAVAARSAATLEQGRAATIHDNIGKLLGA